MIVLCLVLGLASLSMSATAPDWSSSYMVRGLLSIPFAEIEEPFSAWVDLDLNKSRIDYYGGMVKTFQRGDLKSYGTSVKVATTRLSGGNDDTSFCLDNPHD